MSRKKQQTTKFITKDILKSSVIGAFKKLDPRYMLKNPVMFVVEVGFVKPVRGCDRIRWNL